eukprot:10858073-Alexandrium_andersonii.AAC.1
MGQFKTSPSKGFAPAVLFLPLRLRQEKQMQRDVDIIVARIKGNEMLIASTKAFVLAGCDLSEASN